MAVKDLGTRPAVPNPHHFPLEKTKLNRSIKINRCVKEQVLNGGVSVSLVSTGYEILPMPFRDPDIITHSPSGYSFERGLGPRMLSAKVCFLF